MDDQSVLANDVLEEIRSEAALDGDAASNLVKLGVESLILLHQLLGGEDDDDLLDPMHLERHDERSNHRND